MHSDTRIVLQIFSPLLTIFFHKKVDRKIVGRATCLMRVL